MKSNFATRAKAIETMYGVDSGTTRKLLKELYNEQKKFAGNNPNMVGDVPITGKGLSTNDFMDMHGNMDLNMQQKRYLNESKGRDESNESGAYKRWQEDVLNLQDKKAASGFNDTTRYPSAPPRFGQQPARIPTSEVNFADGGSIFDHPLIQQLAKQRLQQKYGAKEELAQVVPPQNGQQVTESTPPPSVAQSAYAPVQQKIDKAVSQTNTMPPNVPYFDIIKKYFKEDQWSNAARVMMGESAGNAKAFRGEKRNPGGGNDSGLFQFNSKYHPEVYLGGDVMDAEYNIKSAAQLHSKEGWKPWYAAKKYNISADGGNLYPRGGGIPSLTVPQKTKTDQWIESLMGNVPQFAQSEELFKLLGNTIGAPINYATGTLGGQDAYTAAMPVLGATGRAARTVEDAMNKGYRAEELAGREAATVVQPTAAIPKYSGNAPTLQSSQFAAQDADNARKFMAAGIVGGAGTLAYNAKVNGLPGINNTQPNGITGITTPTPFQIPNMNYSTQDNPNLYDSKAGPQNTGDVGAYAKNPVRPGNLSPLQPRGSVLPFNAPPNELAPTPDFTKLHPDAPSVAFDVNNLMRMAPVLANMIPGRRQQGIPNDLTLPRVNAQKFAPDYLSTAPVTEQLGSQYRTGVGELAGLTGGSASAMRSGLQGLNRSTGRSAGEALADIYGRNTGLKNSAEQYNLENVNKANMFNAEMGAKEALSRKDMDVTNKELSLHYTNQEQQRRAAAFTQLGQIGKENVQNKLAEKIYGYDKNLKKITDPRMKDLVVYKENPKISYKKSKYNT